LRGKRKMKLCQEDLLKAVKLRTGRVERKL